ncbi:hypothetical protein [Streptomyces sp. NBC_01304]|uniref:hypothetical protein n=1 Tax=Streptomyces sp. NBC_01304 TaxID=2903818 RepID=UPI002E0E4BF2|nr:hypothetical protein OG430_44770 [Streptomyces sp. NBC_01304]
MAEVSCFAPVRGRRLRATRLTKCGNVDYGDLTTVVTKGVITVKYSFEIDEGEDILVKNFAGETCVADPACPQIKWINVEIAFCNIDPTLVQMMNPTWVLERDGKGNIIGFRVDQNVSCDRGAAIEVWTGMKSSAKCVDGEGNVGGKYGYLLLPWVTGGTPSDIEIGNEAVSFTLTGKSKVDAGWGVGPYNVLLGADDKPGPLLAPVSPTQPMIMFETNVEPPEPKCGAQPLHKDTHPLDPPTGLKATPTTGSEATSLSVEWNPVTSAETYEVTAEETH